MHRPRSARFVGAASVGFAAFLVVAVIVGLQLRPGPTRGPTVPEDTDTGASDSLVPAASVPPFGHVYVIVLENETSRHLLEPGKAPYFKSLASRFGLATSYEAVARPSQPNYLALFSGSTQGVTDNEPHDLSARNLADELEAKGRSWRVFAENVPGGCYTGADASGGPDGQGNYARKHEPAISFTGISHDTARCANITDFSHFDPAAADFELIIPNLCHDMHDCSVDAGDAWLRSFVPRIIDSPAWRAGGLLFITFDEGSVNGSQTVATLVISPKTPAGFTSATPHTHYSLLRTIEDIWGLGCLDEDCDANSMGEFFRG